MSYEPITETWLRRDSDIVEIDHGDHDAIRALLLGRKVHKVADDHLLLDNGTVLRVVPNEGGCSCGAGDYYLTDLNDVDNVITNVEFVDEPDDDWEADGGYYEIFVVAEDKHIRLMRVEGTDGNGYYGTGYRVLVRPAATEAAQ